MDPILLQKQLKDNANDLQDMFKDLKNWGDEMKRKDEDLKKSHSNGKDNVKKLKTAKTGKNCKTASKITCTDYSKWDKFDAEAECEKLDGDISEDSELTDENDESNRDEALLEKEKGNKFVKEQKWKEAIKCYTNAIDFYSYDPIFYANRALCYLRIGEMNKAEDDCNLSIKLDSSYVKAFQRRAAAREALNKLSEAKSDLLRVLHLEPKNGESKAALDILRTKMGEYVKPPDLTENRPVSKFTAARKNIKPADAVVDNKTIETEKVIKQNDDIIVVKPIKKAPHMRSKKPLKRMPIIDKDIMPAEVEAVKTNVLERKQPVETSKPVSLFKQKQSTKSVQEVSETALPKATEPQNTIKSDDFKVVERVTKEAKNLCNDNKKHQKPVLTVPKNAVQFNLTWDSLSTLEEKYEYLQCIKDADLPKIFQEDLESKYFGDILDVLVRRFTVTGEAVYSILYNLSRVKRFSMLTMFMSDSDKNNAKKLFDYVKRNEVRSKEEVEMLEQKFEF